MKKKLLTFITISAIIFSACAQQKKATASKASATKAAATKIEQVAMERTPCFGTCPAYRIEINKNGHAKYTSMHYTEYEGVYEKNFDAAQVAILFKEFESYKVDTCKEEYNNMIADVPGLNYYIKYAKKTTTISNAHFGPDFLSELSKKVDEFAKVDGTWKKTGESGAQKQ